LVPTEISSDPPEIFGQLFDGPMPAMGELPEHFALHAWFYVDNPQGQFVAWNSAMTPPSWIEEMHTAAGSAFALADPTAATGAGYVSTGECVTDPALGGMGVHWSNSDITTLDAGEPHVLLFEEVDGVEQLVAVEWLVPAADVVDAPVLVGQTFDGPLPAHDPLPEHYALHMWLKPNPGGIFDAYNPLVGCP
jgi:hypothetical protein